MIQFRGIHCPYARMHKRGIRLGYETRGRCHQKPGPSVAPQKGLMSYKFFFKKNFSLWRLLTTYLYHLVLVWFFAWGSWDLPLPDMRSSGCAIDRRSSRRTCCQCRSCRWRLERWRISSHTNLHIHEASFWRIHRLSLCFCQRLQKSYFWITSLEFNSEVIRKDIVTDFFAWFNCS